MGIEKTSCADARQNAVDQFSFVKRLRLTVNLLKRKLLGLANKAENHHPGNKVETSVETNWKSRSALSGTTPVLGD